MASALGRDGRRLARIPIAAWLMAVVAVVVAGVALTSLGASSPSSPGSALLTGSGYPNADLSNTRYAGGPIDAATVAKLEVAWTLPLSAKSEYGSYSSSPIVAGGVIFSQDLGLQRAGDQRQDGQGPVDQDI